MRAIFVDVATTRRFAIGLMSISGALLFSAFNLIGAGISGGDRMYAAAVSASVWPLASSGFIGLVSFIFAELAALRLTPKEGYPHSKANYLQTAFALLVFFGLVQLLAGAVKLIAAATL